MNRAPHVLAGRAACGGSRSTAWRAPLTAGLGVPDVQPAEHARARRRNAAERAARNALRDQLSSHARATNGCPITTPLAGIAVTFTAPASGTERHLLVERHERRCSSGRTPPATRPHRCSRPTGLPAGIWSSRLRRYGSVVFSLVNTTEQHARRDQGAGLPSKPVSGRRSPLREAAAASTVVDANGKPIAGASVTFTLGGAAEPRSDGRWVRRRRECQLTGTDAVGIATSPTLFAGEATGAFTATASVSGVNEPRRFALDDLAAKPPRITIVGRRNELGSRRRALRAAAARCGPRRRGPPAGRSGGHVSRSAASGAGRECGKGRRRRR